MVYTKLILIWGAFLLPAWLFAATSQFTIGVLAGEDTTPPTTPTLLEVVPISAHQIDVSWSASTDDILLGGYVLLRDSVPIATTTLLSFSDTGLLPETLYEYTVYAFDWLNNLSTTSDPLATTTLALPPPPPPATTTPTTRPPTSRTVVLSSLDITTTEQSAQFNFSTDRPARFRLRWGRTEAVLGGYIENHIFQTEHYTVVAELEPGTRYFYELTAYTPAGISEILSRGQFTTLVRVLPETPVNVSNLTITVNGDDVRLSYRLPEGDIRAVRIVRNHRFYPADIYDGAVVYEGRQDGWLDRGALSQRSPQYYTVFVIMTDGSVSSGAVGRAERAVGDDPINETLPTRPLPPELPEITPITFSLDRSDIQVIQGNRVQSMAREVTWQTGLPILIKIRREALPPHLKSIIVSVLDPSDQRVVYTFLLKLSRDGEAYEATLPPPRVRGESRLRLEVYDFETAVTARYQVPVSVIEIKPEPTAWLEDTLFSTLAWLWYVILALASLGLGLLIWRRRRD